VTDPSSFATKAPALCRHSIVYSHALPANGVSVDVERRLVNQDAFDIAVLHLLNQGHCCFNASGKPKYRSPRGKSAIGALIPDQLYVATMEGKTIQQLLSTSGTEYANLRERLARVTPALLGELQDLHDRVGECLPSLVRHLVVAGGLRIAQAFGLSSRLVRMWVAYQRLPGPRLMQPAVENRASRPVAPQPTGDRDRVGKDRAGEDLQLVA
jgi:hypothetical protein